MTPEILKQAVAEAQCKVLDLAWDTMYALLPEPGQRGRDLADAVVTFEVAMENLKEVLRGERRKAVVEEDSAGFCPRCMKSFKGSRCLSCRLLDEVERQQREEVKNRDRMRQHHILDAGLTKCPICHVALYDEAAKVGYCTVHEPKGAPGRKVVFGSGGLEVTKPIIAICQCGTTFNIQKIGACPKCFPVLSADRPAIHPDIDTDVSHPENRDPLDLPPSPV